MSPSLAELERALAARILGGTDPAVERWVRVPAGADAGARLAVHTAGYPARVTESLREAFPATALILGDGSFASLGERYAAQLPAELRNLNDAGAALSAFLRSDPLGDRLPFLPDLARLEWAVVECFHSELTEPFDASVCAGWGMDDWAEARVEFQPGMALVRSAWPIRELREARHRERSAIDVDLTDRPDRVLVSRRGFEVAVETVEAIEALAIERLLAGDRLGEVTAHLAAAGAEVDAVAHLFGRWASLGLVAACRSPRTA
jgi:hypothetical protein